MGWASLIVAAVALALSGCAEKDEPAPPPAPASQVVAEAAAATFAERTTALTLRVSSGRARYDAEGPIDLGGGRFLVNLGEISSEDDFRVETVIGLDGEGFENTVQETTEPPFTLGEGRRCWFNPHSPVGSFLGTASVEESVRLVGAIVESLQGEIEAATLRGSAYAVRLRPSAGRPRDDFRERPSRVWGDRALFAQLRGPILVGVDDGRVDRIALRLRDYQPYVGKPIARVSIAAELAPTDQRLESERPSCQAIE